MSAVENCLERAYVYAPKQHPIITTKQKYLRNF